MKFFLLRIVPLITIILLTASCYTPYVTHTPRSGVEQLLLSTSADRALKELDASSLEGKKVYLEVKNIESYDKGYVIGSARNRLGEQGVIVVDDLKAADLNMEIYSGGLGTDGSHFVIGIPEIPMALGALGSFVFPELALVSRTKQTGISKLVLHARDTKTKAQDFSSGSLSGKAYYNRWKIIFVPFRLTDIPEMKKKDVEKEEEENEIAANID